MKDFRVDHLKKSYGIKNLLADVSFILNEGEHVGLIGQNGTGKSTLLNILAGLDESEAGTIEKSNDFRIAYLTQSPEFDASDSIFEAIYHSDNPSLRLVHDYEAVVSKLAQEPMNEELTKQYQELEHRMNQEDGWKIEVTIKSILNQLGIDDVQQKISSLSGGQKKRVGLAKVLMEEADLLILDEPTNHLDMQAIEWLEKYLAGYTGSLLLVTHDRYFLERVVSKIYELDRGKIQQYPGNYQDYLRQKSEQQELEARLSHKQQQLYLQELAWMRQGAQARSTKQQARIHRFEALEEKVKQKNKEQGLEISLDQSRIGKRVFQLQGVSLSIAGQSIVKNLDWIIQAKDRIGIVGENGVGKTTLLNALAGLRSFDEGTFVVGDTVRIAYYKQLNEDLPMDKQVIQYMREYAEEVKQKNGEVASVTELLETFLFPRAMHGATIGSLSGGERRRLYLLKLLVTKPNVLLLDEPTNDLDIDTLTVLENYIKDFQGAVVTVSHDRYFLDKVTQVLFEIQGCGETRLYYGSMTDFLDDKREEMKSKPVSFVEPKPVISTTPMKKKLSYQEQREWDGLEERIMNLEETIEEIQTSMMKVANDFVALQEWQDKLNHTQIELEKAYQRWEELAPFA